MNETLPLTLEEIQGTIRAARDSVWVIEDEIAKLVDGKNPSKESQQNIERNVAHLKLIVSDASISSSSEDITDLHAAIAAGEAKLAENIWPQ